MSDAYTGEEIIWMKGAAPGNLNEQAQFERLPLREILERLVFTADILRAARCDYQMGSLLDAYASTPAIRARTEVARLAIRQLLDYLGAVPSAGADSAPEA
jgi:hypothetical protein